MFTATVVTAAILAMAAVYQYRPKPVQFQAHSEVLQYTLCSSTSFTQLVAMALRGGSQPFSPSVASAHHATSDLLRSKVNVFACYLSVENLKVCDNP